MITLWGGFVVVVANFYLICFASLIDLNIMRLNQALLAYHIPGEDAEVSLVGIDKDKDENEPREQPIADDSSGPLDEGKQ